ncbi:hypothetical protein Lal_00027116 [Lupinus albus]|nr:hypothetical protein Lal_00027116 [Lupinus albus]
MTLMKNSKTTMVFSLTLGCVSSIAPQKSHISLHLLQSPLFHFHFQDFPNVPPRSNRKSCVASLGREWLAWARISQFFSFSTLTLSLRRESGIEISSESTDKIFKVIGHRLMPFLTNPSFLDEVVDEFSLVEPAFLPP